MDKPVDIIETKMWTTRQLAWIVCVAISITFTLTKIYDEFRLMQIEQKVESDRADKRYNRIMEDIHQLKSNHPEKE